MTDIDVPYPDAPPERPGPAFRAERPGRRLDAAERDRRSAHAPFGSVLTEHMVTLRWDRERGWHDGVLSPYRPLELDPATAGLHYGQVVFEGLKVYRREDGSLAAFRPHRHAERFRRSAERLRMPGMPDETFLEAVELLVGADADWVPHGPGRSLYLRPLMFAADPDLALRPSRTYSFLLVAFVTERFFGDDPRAVDVWVARDHARAAPGGTGAAKCAGNYAGAFAAQDDAARHGCDQVVWLDPVHRRMVEELGGMNLFLVEDTGGGRRLVTPPESDTILRGVTRDSVLELAAREGLAVEQRPVSIDEWRDGCAAGRIPEAFACGTAAQITSVGRVRDGDREWTVGDGRPGPTATGLDRALGEIHRGAAPDPAGWMYEL